MRWLGSERKAARVFMVARCPLLRVLAQLLLDVTLLSYQAHQGLRLMGIELIGDEDPSGLWIGLDALANVGGEISLRAGGAGHFFAQE